MSVCDSECESLCTNPPSVTCNRQKSRTNTLQQVTDRKPGLTYVSMVK